MAANPADPVRTILDVNGCSRCDSDGHPQLEFRRFARPAVIGDIELTHWALCPTSGEPILMGHDRQPDDFEEIDWPNPPKDGSPSTSSSEQEAGS